MGNEIEYAAAKAVIKTTDKEGNIVSEMTTWRGDLIKKILEGSHALHSLKAGCKISIEVTQNKELNSEEKE